MTIQIKDRILLLLTLLLSSFRHNLPHSPELRTILSKHHRLVLPGLLCKCSHIVYTFQCLAFSLNIMFVRVIHLLVCSWSFFILIATTHDLTTVRHGNILQCMYPSPDDGHLFTQVLNLCGQAYIFINFTKARISWLSSSQIFLKY